MIDCFSEETVHLVTTGTFKATRECADMYYSYTSIMREASKGTQPWHSVKNKEYYPFTLKPNGYRRPSVIPHLNAKTIRNDMRKLDKRYKIILARR